MTMTVDMVSECLTYIEEAKQVMVGLGLGLRCTLLSLSKLTKTFLTLSDYQHQCWWFTFKFIWKDHWFKVPWKQISSLPLSAWEHQAFACFSESCPQQSQTGPGKQQSRPENLKMALALAHKRQSMMMNDGIGQIWNHPGRPGKKTTTTGIPGILNIHCTAYRPQSVSLYVGGALSCQHQTRLLSNVETRGQHAFHSKMSSFAASSLLFRQSWPFHLRIRHCHCHGTYRTSN